MEIGVAHETAVHKEELLGAPSLYVIQIGAETAHAHNRCLNLNRQKRLIHLASKQIDDSLLDGRNRQ